MALSKLVYPLDLTGERTSNRVTENHVIGTLKYRAFALKNGPFFTENLSIAERSTNKSLKRGVDYECVYLLDLTNLTEDSEVCGVIVIHNTAISTDIVVEANIVGGPYTKSAETIALAIEALELNNGNIYWQDIIDKPDLFQPPPHMHDFADVFGMEFLIDVIANIRDVLLIGNNKQMEQIRRQLETIETEIRAEIKAHKDSKNNPHGVTAEQVDAYDKEKIDQFIQAINKAFGDLEPRFSSITQSLTAINLRIDGLNRSIGQTNIQVAANDRSLSLVHQSLAMSNEEISKLWEEINRIDRELNSLRTKDNELSQAILANSNKINAEKLRNDGHDRSIELLQEVDIRHDNELNAIREVDETQNSSLGTLDQVTKSNIDRLTIIEEKLKKTDVGLIKMFPTLVAPEGHLKLGPGSYSRETYANLYEFAVTSGNMAVSEAAKQAGQFGPGNGSTTFTLPNPQGLFVRVLDEDGNVNPSRTIGTLEGDSVKADSISYRISRAYDSRGGTGGYGWLGGGQNQYVSGWKTGEIRMGDGVETRPKNIAWPLYIKY